MRGRPLCAASVIYIGILVLMYFGFGFFQTDTEFRQDASVFLNGQVEQIQGVGEKQSLVVRDVMQGESLYCKRMKVYDVTGRSLFQEIKIGQIISIAGTASSFLKPGNPGQFNEYQYYSQQGIQYKCLAKALTIKENTVNRREQFLYELRSLVHQSLYSCLPEKDAGIMAAMLLGEKAGLDEEINDLYKNSGISHILAISGLHISMIGMGLFYLLRRYVMPMKVAACTTALLLILYGELTGFPIATKRAVLMMLCMLGARFLGERYDRLSALALSALIQLAFSPASLFQSGFLLSYGTVLGITVFVDEFQETVSLKHKWWKAVAGSLGIFLVTFPVLLYFYYEWNPYSFLINTLLLPFVSVLIGFAIFVSVVSAFQPVCARFFSGFIHVVLQYYETICRLMEKLPCHRIITGRPELWQILLYYVLLGLFCYMSKPSLQTKPGLLRRRKHRILLIAAAVILVLFRVPESSGPTITNLDVGQGDCAVIRAEGKVILIDGGSSDVKQVAKYRISRYLKYYGINRIDYFYITHSDSDHVNGLMEILQDRSRMGLQIGAVVVPDIEKRDAEYKNLVSEIKKCGIPLIKMKWGGCLCSGGMTVRCLHPAPDYEWKTENDYSMVLQLDYGSFRGIFTGDLEEAGEREILERISDVDYLKVGHHGSKGSSSAAFLEKISPETSVISAGYKNRYGHPAKETLERLEKSGAKVYSTIDCGAVTIKVGEEGYQVSAYCQGEK